MSFQISKLKRTILGISIAIVLVLFIGYGISTFYKSPQYEDFCQERFPEPARIEKGDVGKCEAVLKANDAFESSCYRQDGIVRYEADEDGCQVANVCDMCSKKYRESMEVYNRNVFIIAVIAGLIAVILGGVVLQLESVSAGIMGGGVLSIIYGTLRYWGDMADFGRFVILGAVLTILILLGYKKFKK
ncbi:hypothetical protein KY366_08345 [Candidatus Woesearchaeota archaeon]|nr:hypothetical protein [Candidatus Woesearchaeota archaeon]